MTSAATSTAPPVGGEPHREASARPRIAARGALLAGLAALAYRDLARLDAPASAGVLPGVAPDDRIAGGGDLSPALIAALFAWLLVRRRALLRASLRSWGGWSGAAALLATGAGLCIWSRHTGAIDWLVPSLSLVVLGAGALLGGAPALRALRFPALFLLLAMPAPAILRHHAMYPLQRATAALAAALHGAFAGPVLRHGDALVVDGEWFEVIETCSGMASIEALAVAALVYVELSYRSRLQALALLAAAPLVAFALNGFRVLWLIGDADFDPRADHSLAGLVAILAGAFVLTRLDALLARAAPARRAPRRADPPVVLRAALAPRARWALLALLLAALAATPWLVPGPPPAGQREPLAAGVPARVGPWRARDAAVDARFLGSVAFSEAIARRYERPGSADSLVELLVARDDRSDRGLSASSPKLELPGFGWRIEEREARAPPAAGWRAESLWLRSREGLHLVHTWSAGVAPLPVELARALLALDRSFLRRDEPALFVRVSTPVAASPAGPRLAELRLARFEKSLARAPLFEPD